MTTRQMSRRGLGRVSGRHALAPLLVAFALVLPTGCGKSGGSSDEAKPLPSIGAPAPGTLDPTLEPTIQPDGEILGAEKVEPAPFTDTAGFVRFTNPTKDVSCTIIPSATATTLHCQPVNPHYTVKESGTCPPGQTWGTIVELITGPNWTCSTEAPTTAKALQYGGRMDVQDFSCVSRPDGMTCRNARTDHGFRISPAFYTFF